MSNDNQQKLVDTVERLGESIKAERKKLEDGLSTVGETQVKLEKMGADLQESIDKLSRTEINRPESTIKGFDGTRKSFEEKVVQANAGTDGVGEMIKDLQEANDHLILVDAVRRASKANRMHNAPSSIKDLKAYSSYKSKLENVMKLTDFEAATAAEWIPIDMSPRLRDFYLLNLRVASLFNEFTLPTATFDWPHVTAAPEAEYIPASTTGADAFTAPADASQMFGGTDPSDNNRFSARKVRAFSFYSREWSEDTIAATAPWLRRQLGLAVARAWEEMIINGDENGDMTSDSPTASTDWNDGLRHYAMFRNGAWVGDGTDPHAHFYNAATGTNILQAARSQRKKMDKYGVDLPNLAYIVDLNAYYQLLNADDFQKLNEFGPNAHLLTGQVGAVDDIPVILSAHMRDTVYAATTATDNGQHTGAGGTVGGSIICVWREAWLRGRLPGLDSELIRHPLSDQYSVVVFERADFQTIEPAATTHTNYGYGVAEFA